MSIASASSLSTRRVSTLGNAYGALAFLLLPTALGSWLTATALSAFIHEHPILFLIADMIALFGLMFLTFRHRDSGLGFTFLTAFAFAMGLLIGPTLEMTLTRYTNGAQMVTLAFLGTAGLFVTLAAFVHVTKKDFSGLGGILYAALWGLIIAGFANLFFHSSLVESISAGVGALVFSGYILYDVSEALHGRDDNWIVVAMNLYLDVINLFLDLLRLFIALSGSSSDD